MSPEQRLERVTERDRALAKLCKRVRVLTELSWPAAMETDFLSAWEKGDPKLPEPPPIEGPPEGLVEALHTFAQGCDVEDPLERFLRDTAESHALAARLLGAAGTPEFATLSVALFGQPEDAVHPGAPSTLSAARHFIERTRGFAGPEPEGELTAEEVQLRLQADIDRYFQEPLPVQLHEELSGKATAGATRVRVRIGARFTAAGVAQLLQHEALVHAATKRAGRDQPVLSTLGLSSPRTTEAQEGLATFAEMITDAMDIARLRRIALRPIAVHMAQEGADFIQVFEFFLAEGQSAGESFNSARRVFRGGDPRGRVAFTKDTLYLRGLVSVHTFLRKACEARRHTLPKVLFAGRMTLGDALALEPYFEDGTLRMPEVLPDWVRNERCLAAYLTWSVFTDQIRLAEVDLGDFSG
ncbi:MAG: DUF1704 domain-containing protein [Alphaproteobacteria bacterium]|nr:DUF1704 domain-containing protein [Alphaproteobacteria bacterium]MCB9795703.1 DUF1704 domain-containing protein [Alphaproteobacteria bacterium]